MESLAESDQSSSSSLYQPQPSNSNPNQQAQPQPHPHPHHPSITRALVNRSPVFRLKYSIAQASSFSGSYEPHNIIVDRPHDLSSRWSGASVAAMPVSSASSGSIPLALTSTATSNSNSNNAVSSSTLANDSSFFNSRESDLWHNSGGHLNVGAGISNRATAVRSVNSPSSNLQGGSSGSNTSSRQYIILKLDKPAVVQTITFGKYHKAHPCNLRDFKVYGALSVPPSATNEDDPLISSTSSYSKTEGEKGIQNAVVNGGGWIKLLRGGLRNDSIPETFGLRWKDSEGVPFSVQYIKLVPLAAHQPNYNFSVWHISLAGVVENKVVEQVCRESKEYRETMIVRLILKHLRSRAHHSAFEMLLQSSRLGNLENQTGNRNPHTTGSSYNTSPIDRSFEHPLLTQLYDSLCRRGDWEEVERCLEKAARGDVQVGQVESISNPSENQDSNNSNPTSSSDPPLFSHYVHLTTPKTSWSQLLVTDADGDRPSGRGGHQIVFDQDRGIAYLFGGWDGKTDLCDLWSYHVEEKRWRCISYDTRNQNGPGPRSCHKMVFDRRTGLIYLLGKYVDFEKLKESHGNPSASMPLSRSGTPSSASASASASAQTQAQGSGSSSPRMSDETARNARRTFLPPGPGGEDSQEDLFISARGASTRLGSNAVGSGSTNSRVNPPSRLNPSSSNHNPTFNPENVPNSPSSSAKATASASSNLSDRNGIESDFYCFSTRNERWTCLSSDTSLDGGPKQLFDHEMIIDSETQLIYIFGGRVVHHDPGRIELSGMWRYDVIQRSWTFLFDDDSVGNKILSRTGHCMVLDSNPGFGNGGKQLWILAGQRGDSYLASMYTYNLSTGAIREISRDYSGNGPEAGFTPRLAIDSNSRELYLFSGLTPTKKKGNELKNSFWLYRIEEDSWSLIYQTSSSREEQRSWNSRQNAEDSNVVPRPFGDPSSSSDFEPPGPSSSSSSYVDDEASFFPRSPEPRPRYAVQMVHDARNASFYLFGGNPLDAQSPSLRLDDFWRLNLIRPTTDEVLRKTLFKVRKQRFLEMASQAKIQNGGMLAMNALVYLQTQVGSCVDHSNEFESTVFRKLMTNLLQRGGGNGAGAGANGEDEEMNEDDIFGTINSDPHETQNSEINTPKAQKISPSPLSNLSDNEDDDDGLPEDDEDSEMLSISQTLPAEEPSNSASAPQSSSADPLLLLQNKNSRKSLRKLKEEIQKEGKPSEIYSQRISLFENLLTFFPPNATQPTRISLGDCIESSLTKRSAD